MHSPLLQSFLGNKVAPRVDLPIKIAKALNEYWANVRPLQWRIGVRHSYVTRIHTSQFGKKKKKNEKSQSCYYEKERGYSLQTYMIDFSCGLHVDSQYIYVWIYENSVNEIKQFLFIYLLIVI